MSLFCLTDRSILKLSFPDEKLDSSSSIVVLNKNKPLIDSVLSLHVAPIRCVCGYRSHNRPYSIVTQGFGSDKYISGFIYGYFIDNAIISGKVVDATSRVIIIPNSGDKLNHVSFLSSDFCFTSSVPNFKNIFSIKEARSTLSDLKFVQLFGTFKNAFCINNELFFVSDDYLFSEKLQVKWRPPVAVIDSKSSDDLEESSFSVCFYSLINPIFSAMPLA